MARDNDDFDDGRRSTRDRIYGNATSGRDGRRGLATMVLAVAVFLLVGAVSARQVTAPGPARDILESGIAVTTEIEQVIAEEHEAMRQLAESSSAATFTIPDYPLDVILTRDEIVKSSDAELRRIVLEHSSGLVYANGLHAFDRTGNQSFGRLSSKRLLEFGVSQVSQGTHDRANLLSVMFLLIAAGAGCVVVLSGEGWGRLRGLGFGIAGGALPGIIIFGLAWAAVARTGGSDPFEADLRDIIQTTLQAPLRNYFVALVLGALLVALGIAFGIVESRLMPAGDPAQPEDAF